MKITKSSLHIHDAIRHTTERSGNRVRHKLWSKDYYVYMTPVGNFKYRTPEGDLTWDWLKPTHPKTGWEIVNEL